MNKKKARVIAFYLPQYHPIPENDEWWGKGYTEWTNVGKSKPLFRGHYQPRVPADLGYYDLRLSETREAQAKMAKETGVEGFMYWHYWFGNGKRLLERPFNEVLKSGKPDFPFCLGWANHSWTTRTWDPKFQNKKDAVILEQLYPGENDYISHFYEVFPAFKDARYITVDEKPLFLIYSPLSFADLPEFIKIWNNLAIQNGLNGVHFVGLAGGWLHLYEQTLKLGVDAIAVGNSWHAETKIKGKYRLVCENMVRNLFPNIWLNKFRYKDIIRNYFNEFDTMENAYPVIIPQWDRSARSGRRAVIYTGATPELFKLHVEQALEIVENKPENKRIVFLRSWNEWAEGNYVEPDLRYGHGYLDVLRECIFE